LRGDREADAAAATYRPLVAANGAAVPSLPSGE
jgi:hypothetical protein